MRYALGTSAATIRAAPLLLIDVDTEEGVTGRAYLFAYRRSGARAMAEVLHDAVTMVKGEAVAPVALGLTLQRRFALIGVTGVVRMALSALELGAVGRPRDRRRAAARDAAWRGAAPHSGLQQQRPRAHGPGEDRG